MLQEELCAFTTQYYKNSSGVKKHKATPHENNTYTQCKFESISKLEMKLHINRNHKKRSAKNQLLWYMWIQNQQEGKLAETHSDCARRIPDQLWAFHPAEWSEQTHWSRSWGNDRSNRWIPTLKCNVCAIYFYPQRNHLNKHAAWNNCK